jgi:hypothetical protein
MAYCTNTQVRAIVDTDISDAEITELIAESDEWLDVKLDTGSLSATYLRMLSRTLTAVRCMLKDPNSQALGEYREDREYALKKLNAMLDEMMSDAEGGIAFRYSYADLRFPIV